MLRDLQRSIEPQFEHLTLVELEVAIGEQASADAQSAADPSPDGSATAATAHDPADRANARAHCAGFNHVAFAGTFPLNVALGIGGVDAVLAGNASNGGDQRHGSVLCVDGVKAQQ